MKLHLIKKNANKIFVALAVLIAGVMIFGALNHKSFKGVLELKNFAKEIIKTCSGADNRQACYDQEIPKVMNKGVSMEQSFDVIKLIQSEDSGYWFCHAVAHKLSSNEYYRDPSQWASVMGRCPSGMCSNGCLHGALQAHFSSESLNSVQIEELLPDLQGICEKRENWNPTPQEQSSCYHELGHLSMYLTDSDINAAAHICDTVGIKKDGRNYLQTCHEGIFMQVFEPREPDDFSLIHNLVPEKDKLSVCEQYSTGVEKGACWKIGWKNSYNKFCDTFSGDVRNACFREAWVIVDEKIRTADGIINYCGYAKDSIELKKCYNKVFYGLMATFNFDVEMMKPICSALPKNIESQCFANTASRLIETDKDLINQAVGVCTYAAKIGVADDCYRELSYYANFVFASGSSDKEKLCRALPTGWSDKCLNSKQR